MKSYWWDRLLSMEGQNVHLGKVMLCPNGIEKGINLVAIIKIKNSFFLSDGLFIVYNVLQIRWACFSAQMFTTRTFNVGYLQYLSISFCSSPLAFALFAIRFKRGYSNVNNPGTFISLMHTIIAVCFKCLGIDLLFVSPSAASP